VALIKSNVYPAPLDPYFLIVLNAVGVKTLDVWASLVTYHSLPNFVIHFVAVVWLMLKFLAYRVLWLQHYYTDSFYERLRFLTEVDDFRNHL
jgi:hypothetical protein